jgi:iron complex outermembrane recepter protein
MSMSQSRRARGAPLAVLSARRRQLSSRTLTVASVLGLILTWLSGPCLGQSLDQSLPPAPNSDVLGDIVVTAGLRQTRADTLSASTSVIDATQLHDAQAMHLEDLLGGLANVNWAGDSQRPRYLQIRGLGELEAYQGAPNPSVGLLIDEMDFSGLGGIATLADIDQVDIYRGPQGTRFGANALAGLIYLHSQAPSEQLTSDATVGVGNENSHVVAATLNLPTALAALRLNVADNVSNGAYRNVTLQRDNTNARHERTLRLAGHSTLGSAVTIDWHILHADFNDGYDAFSPLGGRVTYSDQPGVDSQLSTGYSTHVTYQLSPTQHLEWIYADVSSHLTFSYDGDWGSAAFWAPYTDQFSETQQRTRHTRSMDLRLGGDTSLAQGWRLGLYSQNLTESLTDLSAGVSDDPINGYYAQNLLTRSNFTARSLALYAQWDQALAQHWQLSTGLRGERHAADYTDVVIDAIAATSLTHAFAPVDHLWGGHVTLSHPVPLGNITLSASRGYKAAGFNLSAGIPSQALLFKPESALNLEASLNSRFWDERIAWDSDVFWLSRNNAQIKSAYQSDPTNPNTFVFYTGNAHSAIHRGVESNLTVSPNHWLSVHAHLGLLHTEFNNFAQLADTTQAVSRELAHAPHVSGSSDVTFKNANAAYMRVELAGMSGFYYDLPPNNTRSAAYLLTNLSAGVKRAAWEANLSVRNAFNHNYTVRGFYFGLVPPNYTPTLYTQLGEPRLWSLSLSYHLKPQS